MKAIFALLHWLTRRRLIRKLRALYPKRHLMPDADLLEWCLWNELSRYRHTLNAYYDQRDEYAELGLPKPVPPQLPGLLNQILTVKAYQNPKAYYVEQYYLHRMEKRHLGNVLAQSEELLSNLEALEQNSEYLEQALQVLTSLKQHDPEQRQN